MPKQKRFGNQEAIEYDTHGHGGWAWQDRNDVPGPVIQCEPVAELHEPRPDTQLPPDNVLTGAHITIDQDELRAMGIDAEEGYDYGY